MTVKNRSKHPRFEMRVPAQYNEALDKLAQYRMKPKSEVVRDLILWEAERLGLVESVE